MTEIKPKYIIAASVVLAAIGIIKVNNILNKKKLLKQNKIIVNGSLDPDQFIATFEKLDMKKEIILEITTYGGYATDYFFVIKYLAMKKKTHKFKIVCHIPKYACSGGWLLANCADSFVFNLWSYVSPFDPQVVNSKEKTSYPIAMFENSKVEKLMEQRGILEASAKDTAQKSVLLGTKIFDLVAKMGEWSPERKNIIYEEFMSGKNLHEMKFLPHELEELGYNVSYF